MYNNLDSQKNFKGDVKSFKDYVTLIRNNAKNILILSSLVFAISVLYALVAKNVYKSTISIKITEIQQNILQNSQANQETRYSDRLIANEIGILENYNTRLRIAHALIDTFKNASDKSLFSIVKTKNGDNHKSFHDIAVILEDAITIEQNPGTDILNISAESRSAFESALIVNVCANEYRKLNLELTRGHLTNLRTFLEKQSQEKLSELGSSEDTLMKFRERGGIVSLDVQSAGLINQLSQLDAQRDAAKIELMSSNEVLKQYKFFLNKQDPKIVQYLENEASQAYIEGLQNQIAELQVNRDVAFTMKNSNIDVTSKIKDYDQRINELKQKLSAAINSIKTDAYGTYPDQVRQLAQRMVEEEINNNSLAVKLEQLENIIRNYEQDFRKLPKASIELAQYERKRESVQQLYAIIEQRYQEAMINELSQPGNVFVIGEAVVPDAPEKPNRFMIIFLGLILGPVLSFGYLLIRDYLDNTIKSPEDIEKNNIKFLTWIPSLIQKDDSDNKKELIVIQEPDSPASEAFRAVRTRIQFADVDNDFHRFLLITSPAENEGKTVVTINLASSYARSDKKVLLIDCDLRKPRIHSVLGGDKRPGLVDYLAGNADLNSIIRKTVFPNLYFVTSGTIPPNPSEILDSKSIKSFFGLMKEEFDMILLDSPPIVAVVDAEILARQVDGTILVVSADKTEITLMKEAVDLMKNDKVRFLGVVLNNFKYKSGYNYYYKYHYGYSKSSGSRNYGKNILKQLRDVGK